MIVAPMVKSRSSIADVAPLGSLTLETWIGIAHFETLERNFDLAGDVGRVDDQLEFLRGRTMFSTPPILMPFELFLVGEVHRHVDVGRSHAR